jgi:citrate synthase
MASSWKTIPALNPHKQNNNALKGASIMRGPEQLFENENAWVTSMGACFLAQGRVVFRGKDLFRELKDLPWMALLLYGITGRIPTENQIRLFEGIWTLCTSYPDPRIWNNRVAALAGTTRSTSTLGVSAANAVSEASIYGRRPDIRAIDFLYRTKYHLDQGAELTELIKTELSKYRGIAGYGRPMVRTDERIEPLIALAKTLGFSSGPYVNLAFRIEDILTKGRFRLHMNIAALAAALAADQGFSSRDYYNYLVLSFSAGMLTCYIDASNKPEGTLFPLRCDRVNYEGPSLRKWEPLMQK